MALIKPVFNSAVSISPFDSAANEEMVICEVPTSEDITQRYAIPRILLDFLKSFDGSKEIAQLSTAYQEVYPEKYSKESLEQLVNNFLLPKGLLIDPLNTTTKFNENSKRHSFLSLKARLISADTINGITPALAWLFNKTVFITCLLIIFAIHLIFYLGLAAKYPLDISKINGYDFVYIIIPVLISVFAHEWGHASAFSHYGCKKAEIGWGIYLVFFVFYTDVSEAWRLTRKQRAMIDIGGIYFQSICLVFILLLFFLTKSSLWLYCFFIIDLQIVGALNPFLRTDGYWLVVDLFGITNLRSQSLDVLKFYLYKLLPFKHNSSTTKLTTKANATLIIYTLVGSLFFFYLYKMLFHQVVYGLIPAYPGTIMSLWKAIQQQPISVVQILGSLIEVIWKGLAILGILVVLLRVLLKCSRYLHNCLLSFRATKILSIANK